MSTYRHVYDFGHLQADLPGLLPPPDPCTYIKCRITLIVSEYSSVHTCEIVFLNFASN